MRATEPITDNLLHTPELLRAITATSAQITDAEQPENRWESEGGR